MMESGYYPMGAEHDPNAPYNEPSPNKYRDFKCTVTATIAKDDMDITSNDYVVCDEKDEDGTPIHEIITDNIEWDKDYLAGGYSIIDLLDELRKYVEHDISMTGINTSKGRHLQRLLHACQGWYIEDLYVSEI